MPLKMFTEHSIPDSVAFIRQYVSLFEFENCNSIGNGFPWNSYGKKKKKWPIKIKDEILDTNNEYARYAEKKNSVNLFKYLEYVCLHHPRIDV